MKLNHRETGSGRPLVIIHGLFGSASNWASIARHLADRWRVLTVDLRNHGESFHHGEMSYAAMADDLARFLDDECDGRAPIVGHSMGGKAAMTLALYQPERVDALVVMDVAPVAYMHRFTDYFDALCGLPLDQIKSRRDADDHLQEAVPEPHIRAFLLHNLRRSAERGWFWRVNLPALASSIHELAGFPAAATDYRYDKPTLFVRGAQSDYIRDDHWPMARTLFPQAELTTVEQAGHWLHAEQPDQIIELVGDFLDQQAP